MRRALSYCLIPAVLSIVGTVTPAAGGDGLIGSNEARVENGRTEVVVVGALHGYHQKNPHYTQQKLRDIIIGCSPDALLFELPPIKDGEATVVDGRLTDRYTNADEGWASQAAAKKLDVPIYPFDIDRRDDARRETGYWRRRRAADAEFEKWLAEHPGDDELPGLKAVRRFREQIQKSLLAFAHKGTPEIINSDAFDSILRANAQVSVMFRELLKAHPDKAKLAKEFEFVSHEWSHRNKVMVEKIVGYAGKHPGGRIIVITGAEHRNVLRDALLDEAAVALKEYWEIDRKAHRK